MFFNLPIINTDLKNGVNYFVPDNVSITCRPRNPIEIKKAISRLINNDILYENMSKASRDNFERFNYKKMINSYEKLFKKLHHLN